GNGNCGAGAKLCGSGCVGTAEQTYGCASPDCSACNLGSFVESGRCSATGTCAIGQCQGGHRDCNDDPSDGCEVATASDPANCGNCKVGCQSSQVCLNGGCASDCGGTLTNCDGGCVDTMISPKSCGKCGTSCPAVPHGAPACRG